jgi:hypothetical protein
MNRSRIYPQMDIASARTGALATVYQAFLATAGFLTPMNNIGTFFESYEEA